MASTFPPRSSASQGKSAVEEIGIVPRDMPNMFVEALTVADGKVHDEAREIAIPPESRIAQIAIEPSQTIFKPAEKAKIKLKLTGPDGKPFVGSTVVAVYDKAVEYISGGSNVPEIKAFFWNWKRHHQPQTESSLDRYFHNLSKKDEIVMQDLGVFGGVQGFQMGIGGWGFGGGGMRAMRGAPAGAAFTDGAVAFSAKSKAARMMAPAALAPELPAKSPRALLPPSPRLPVPSPGSSKPSSPPSAPTSPIPRSGPPRS